MYIYWELFWSFVKVGAFCVGGGYASMPLIQAEVIENHAWMTMPQFIDIFTISQMTPGPIGINAATFVGTKDFTKVDLLGCIVLPISLWCIRHKMSVIRTLCMSGVLGLILGIAGIR